MSKTILIKKAIIIAGGLSSRLYPLTDEKPKCMLEVGGKTILKREIEALQACGVNDIVVVAGYKKEKINYPDIKYYNDNDHHQAPSILRGLLCAEQEMADGFICSYSDIIYNKSVVEKLLSAPGDINLIVDTDWAKQYENRVKHPVNEAELVQVKDNKVIRIGKKVVPEGSHGEFIGLALFSKKGAEILKSHYHRLLREYQGKFNTPFQNAKEFQRAYLTDMIQELIDRGCSVFNVDIQENWIEIDTDEDLEKARKLFS